MADSSIVSDVLRGGGAMGALMRSIDWSRTPVGPVETWPQSLKTALSILLETGFPMYIAWGPEYTQFYNDGYRPILGSTKHPSAMGAGTPQTFAEIWDIIGPMFAGVMQGTATTVVDFLLPLDRHGFVEECYFVFSYSPIRQEDGTVGGVLVTVTETTARVLGERRLKTTAALAARTREARTVRDACRIAADVLDDNRADVPFALIYLNAADQAAALLEGSSGDVPGAVAPSRVPLDSTGRWPIARVLRTRVPAIVDLADEVHGPDDQRITRAMVLPVLADERQSPVGVLVAGLSPRLPIDDSGAFLTMVASQLGTALVGARALEEAQARADALAELDRAKTTFFGNVSHEFRTPLTLLLGPIEEAATAASVLAGEDLQIVHRNALRLWRLVNALLDFSRLEAGRVEARFEPVDLAQLTGELASAFRSAVERAGLRLVVECAPLPEPVFVDREMWEKIVLNLLSNAFKFTVEGTIAVRLRAQGARIELAVADTGVGIDPADLPRVFDRFHRVDEPRARTLEGSGIGLALVRELVAMHGGEVSVASERGRGSTFTVTIPAGSAHLPPERINAPRTLASTATGATPYVQEALRWLPTLPEPLPDAAPGAILPGPELVLVVDDNADMREYIARLFGDRWRVEVAADGAAGLRAARRLRPDVIVSDVMMPGLDGYGLLRALRADEQLGRIPVIFLSARAGEDARVDGLEAGADDYVVKPFQARELIARVQQQILRARLRSIEEQHAMRLAGILEHAPVGVALLRGPSYVFEFANRVFTEMAGGRALLGQTFREALPELEQQGMLERLDRVHAIHAPVVGHSLRLVIDRGRGRPEEMFVDFVVQPLVEDGQVSGTAIVCFEVTELAQARRTAEAANRAKDEFLAMLGHELRNPLAPILTALQLMQLRGVQGAERERTIIERQVRHVVGLVDDLLDVSRIARGKVNLRREQVCVAEVVAKAIEMASPAIEQRHHTLDVDVPSDLAVDADPARLAQVVGNLLTNAAKYTESHGLIRLAAALEGGSVVVRVADNGIGIAPDMMPRIFELFTQEGQDVERSGGGLGIGLAIVRSLVEAHGGRVSAESAGKGRGATFTIELPAVSETAAAELPATGAVPATARRGCRVLIVDDNREGAELLADALRELGHTVEAALDGPAALELASRFRPEVALLDLGLPVMDGYELARRLRDEPRHRGLRLIAVTGYGQDVDRSRTEAAGFDQHLVKPVDVHLVDTLVRQ